MDFGYLLDLAKQNEDQAKDLAKIKRFSTEPPKSKKIQRSRVKTGNIQRFLAQREQEEKQKLLEAKQKKEALLSLREQEKGAKRRVSAMLNRTKGANRSVLEDAKDKYNTAATLSGSYQPDEDDYGYESKASADMFAKMLSKYEKIPDKDYLRRTNSGSSKPQRSLDLNATKARVKQSLDNQEEEERNMKGHRRRKSKHSGEGSSSSRSDAAASSSKRRSPSPTPAQKDKKKKPVKRSNGPPPPPGLDFHSIMQLAAEKQHQPIAVPERAAKQEPEERPLTAREKLEQEESRRRELRKQGKLPPAKHKDYSSEFSAPKGKRGRAAEPPPARKEEAKVSDGGRERDRDREKDRDREEREREKERDREKDRDREKERDREKDRDRGADRERPKLKPQSSQSSSSGFRPKQNGEMSQSSDQRRVPPAKPKQFPPADVRRRSPPREARQRYSPPPASTSKRKASPPPPAAAKRKPAPEPKRKQFPPADLKPRQFPPADLKPRQFPPADLKPRQFPPADVKRKTFRPENMKRFAGGSGPKPNRIESSDSEYDSEMDDFIDDGPLGDENDYSSAIKQIFGYDKSKYRDVDEDVSDMEAGFGTVMQEEARSAKIAAMEDEAEFKKEMEHKRRKMAMKKRGGGR